REVSGQARVKKPADYTVVGKPIPRVELPAKMTGRHSYVHDVRVDGMLHGRVIRPANIGAKIANVDDTALRSIPGARVVRKGDFLGVVAEREEDAIRAARALAVMWTANEPLPNMSELHDALVKIPATDRALTDAGDLSLTIMRAARRVHGRYTW